MSEPSRFADMMEPSLQPVTPILVQKIRPARRPDVDSIQVGLSGYDRLDLPAVWSCGEDLAGRPCFFHRLDIPPYDKAAPDLPS